MEKPRFWAEQRLLAGLRGLTPTYDLAPGGKRIAVFVRPESEEKQGNVHVTFLLNFFDEVARKVPAGK